MRGGKRPGAGRKPSSVNRMSQKAREKAAETGILPHEFLLAVCQGQTIDGHLPDFRERLDAAKAAAPFYAPKLASVDNTLKGEDGPLQVVIKQYKLDGD